MENWEKIIRSCRQTDNKTLKLIDATVLSVNSHSSLFESATVKLITGQVIKDLINASGNKIFVGQSVKVGYRATPDAGWIHLVNGEINPIRLAGYDRENTPSYPADDNQITASEQMILNINEENKLLTGTHPYIMSVQGYACSYVNTTIPVSEVDKFGTHLEYKSYWRATEEDDFQECTHIVDLMIAYIATNSRGDTYRPAIRRTQYDEHGSVIYSHIGIAQQYTAPTELFIAPRIYSLSALPDYSGQPTPHGYVQLNKIIMCVGGIEAANPDVVKLSDGYGSGYQYNMYLASSGTNISCIPLESEDEMLYDFAITKIREPR